MNKMKARYLFVRAGILFFLVLFAVKERPAKEPAPVWPGLPERIEAAGIGGEEKEDGLYHSPVPFDRLWEVNPDIVG